MRAPTKSLVLGSTVMLTVAALWVFAQEETLQQRRQRCTRESDAGNYKAAYDGLRRLALDPANNPPCPCAHPRQPTGLRVPPCRPAGRSARAARDDLYERLLG